MIPIKLSSYRLDLGGLMRPTVNFNERVCLAVGTSTLLAWLSSIIPRQAAEVVHLNRQHKSLHSTLFLQ